MMYKNKICFFLNSKSESTILFFVFLNKYNLANHVSKILKVITSNYDLSNIQ
jgi:hypothetical protein